MLTLLAAIALAQEPAQDAPVTWKERAVPPYPAGAQGDATCRVRLQIDAAGALTDILAAPTPAAAKKFGRAVAGFDNDEWAAKRVDIVRTGNLAKFAQNAEARDVLLQTSGTILVEASPRDTIWGIGLGRDNPRAQRAQTWRGANLLGFALTWTRDQLEAG